jgi:very-long-chain (3R)-3-hydroxyacyl-CoA dehydratase
MVTQSLAALEILHSLIGFVRAPFMTTAMQVASRYLVVWGVMFPFHEGSGYVRPGEGIVGGDYQGVVGKGVGTGAGAQFGDYAFLGCLGAWGITECIRYGFFALQLGGLPVPKWWIWLR